MSNTTLIEKVKQAVKDYVDQKRLGKKPLMSVYLASKLDYHYGYLANTFKKHTGQSIQSFKIETKLEKAKQLYLETDKNLTEIANELDYCSVAHLSNQFKERFGVGPYKLLEAHLEQQKLKSFSSQKVN